MKSAKVATTNQPTTHPNKQKYKRTGTTVTRLVALLVEAARLKIRVSKEGTSDPACMVRYLLQHYFRYSG